MITMFEIYKLWRDNGAWVVAKDPADGQVKEIRLRDFWEHHWDAHPELAEEFNRIYGSKETPDADTPT